MTKAKRNTPKAQEAPQSAEERLDEALEETFPASDPIAVDPEEANEADHQDKKKSR
jgi:hypothetical protein